MYGRWLRNSFIYLLILVAIVAIVFTVFQGGGSGRVKQELPEFIQAVKDNKATDIKVDDTNVTYKLTDDPEHGYKTELEKGDTLRKVLVDANITDLPQYEIKDPSPWTNYLGLLINFLPIIIILAIVFFFLRQAQGSNNQALNFGKSRARMFSGTRPSVTFLDVAGVDEAKEELKEVVEFLKYPEKFAALGARIPKGVLLYGAPGTGKTLLAKAVAGEAGVPFFSSSGSEFVEMFVGVGASRVRDLFDQGRKNAPCLLFVDEIDAVGRHRFAGIGGGHDEREQTLNQLLVEMDGFDTKEGVILIAATNRPDVLDPALLRPGRFDRHVTVPMPDLRGREEILRVHSKIIKLAPHVDFKVIARRTPGFVGADLANLVNEAALLAARRNKPYVELPELEEAIERVIAGPERKTRMISEREKKIVAYHESGHALVAKLTPGTDPVHKVSIIPRGPALGYTLQLPTEDKYLTSRTEIKNRLSVLLGGRVAEELVFSEITTGACDDLSKAKGHRWIMGVLNATPDSFYASARTLELDEGLRRAEQMVHEGADIIDIGGESTRPGSTPVSLTQERERVLPLIQALRDRYPTLA